MGDFDWTEWIKPALDLASTYASYQGAKADTAQVDERTGEDYARRS